MLSVVKLIVIASFVVWGATAAAPLPCGERGVANGKPLELPHVLGEAQNMIGSRGLKDRCRVEPIDFFKSIPPGGDAYVLPHVIHDWTDDECVTTGGY
jgi:hypothetical protein